MHVDCDLSHFETKPLFPLKKFMFNIHYNLHQKGT